MVQLFDKNGTKVAESMGESGNITITFPNLWWPHLMHDDPGYLYTMKIWLHDLHNGEDIVRLKVGLRSVSWNSTGLFINHKKFYFRFI